jgi:hypothetical protein
MWLWRGGEEKKGEEARNAFLCDSLRAIPPEKKDEIFGEC